VSVFNQEGSEEMVKGQGPQEPHKPGTKSRTIHVCNFRSAGRLSNENARSLSAIHEIFARHLATSLDAYLGTDVEVKLETLDQLPLKDHLAEIAPLSYIVPFTSNQGSMIVEWDINLVFPIIELLLGGTGTSANSARELSEIEEEIMQDVTTMVARQAENAWHMQKMSLAGNRRIKSSMLYQYCPPNEKVTLVKFEIQIAGTRGSIQLVFPTLFLNVLLNKIKLEEPQRKGDVRSFPKRSIRERILDCDVVLEAGLPRMKVAVRDLISLRPGSVLKLRAPVRSPGMLSAGGMELFEASPVRNGSQKAAQLGRRAQTQLWEKG
jgi:flagellar motor switch protein FliM